jgi:hypothetical protein
MHTSNCLMAKQAKDRDTDAGERLFMALDQRGPENVCWKRGKYSGPLERFMS